MSANISKQKCDDLLEKIGQLRAFVPFPRERKRMVQNRSPAANKSERNHSSVRSVCRVSVKSDGKRDAAFSCGGEISKGGWIRTNCKWVKTSPAPLLFRVLPLPTIMIRLSARKVKSTFNRR